MLSPEDPRVMYDGASQPACSPAMTNVVEDRPLASVFVNIEHCINCHQHSLHTNHVEERYVSHCLLVARELEKVFPGLEVVVNGGPLPKGDQSTVDSFRQQYPRIGAFEVHVVRRSAGARGQEEPNGAILLGSKLAKGKWPAADVISERLQQVLQGRTHAWEKEDCLTPGPRPWSRPASATPSSSRSRPVSAGHGTVGHLSSTPRQRPRSAQAILAAYEEGGAAALQIGPILAGMAKMRPVSARTGSNGKARPWLRNDPIARVPAVNARPNRKREPETVPCTTFATDTELNDFCERLATPKKEGKFSKPSHWTFNPEVHTKTSELKPEPLILHRVQGVLSKEKCEGLCKDSKAPQSAATTCLDCKRKLCNQCANAVCDSRKKALEKLSYKSQLDRYLHAKMITEVEHKILLRAHTPVFERLHPGGCAPAKKRPSTASAR
eukprot:TRINITY_DN19038_c0_g1_i1.p1 TRINITY_DN19038_c0_g1~~TRINITY_DN19038_c0_g1_i1.p1  ORF type:complete len:439 (+),score=68.60 TRINITY_DN19038_c0_g1_i1:115-1431(+)